MSLEKIKIDDIEPEDGFNYEEVFNKCYVNLDEDLKPAPTALGIGYNDYKGRSYLNNTYSYGEFSCILAKSKSKKTFFKSALIAAYIGGNTESYFPNIHSKRDSDYYILDFDTEQGEFYAQRAFRRVAEMVGQPYANYMPFGVEELEPKEIIQLIDSILEDPKYKGRVKWMSIDGLLDMVLNENDIIESKAVTKKLMKWRRENMMHINCIIHANSEGKKATGHLGTSVQRRSETITLLEDTDPDPDNRNSPIKVTQTYSRGAPFDSFYFDLDERTALPKECENDLKAWTK